MSLGTKNFLEKLNVTACQFSYKGAQPLFQVLNRNTKLKELIIDKNHLEGRRLRVLREMLLNNNFLVTLSMNDCKLEEDGANFLC
jgi:Ran GTPase-activating protein (RanGAP) involved in mRNA processing and transport